MSKELRISWGSRVEFWSRQELVSPNFRRFNPIQQSKAIVYDKALFIEFTPVIWREGYRIQSGLAA